VVSVITLLHGKDPKYLIFQKYFKEYELDFGELIAEARQIVSDIIFFNEFINRSKKSSFGYSIKIDDYTGFFRNLPENYGYNSFNLREEDTVFRMLATKKIILFLINDMNFENMAEFNQFTKGWFDFDFFKDYPMFISTAHMCESFRAALQKWREKNETPL